MGERITFKRPDGKDAAGYQAKAAAGAPGLVVIQEWWGLNEQIKGICDRFAAAGFNVIAPDLYAGRVVPYHDSAAANAEMTSLNFLDATDQTLRGAAQQLLGSGAKKVGVTGFCMGGALTILSLTMTPEADAGVVWYGYPPLEYVDASKIKAPVMAHWATQDAAFAIAGVDALEEKLKAAGVRYEGHRYQAHHAFANETAQGPGRIAITQYDAAWAQMAWDRSLRFLGRTLG